MRRREFVSLAGIPSFTFLAGCSSIFQPTQPNPRVVEFDTEPVSGTNVPTTSVLIEVFNEGGGGDVSVIVVVVDSTGTAIKTVNEEVRMKMEERRQLSMEIQVSVSAESIRVRAEPV